MHGQVHKDTKLKQTMHLKVLRLIFSKSLENSELQNAGKWENKDIWGYRVSNAHMDFYNSENIITAPVFRSCCLLLSVYILLY